MNLSELFKVDSSSDIESKVEALFEFYRASGFPNYDKSRYDVKSEMNKLISFDESSLFDGKYINQSMHGMGLLWTYFPHWVDVECGGDLSLSEKWNDDMLLKSLIRKTYVWQQKYGRGIFTENRIRQNAKVYLAKQSVSNFRPSVAKLIYNNYANEGTVWDMSCGWGGRLFGFLASNATKYIGTEPSSKTFAGLQNMVDDFSYMGKSVELHKLGSEVFWPKPKSIDLCFTSPPYFNTEKYSNEDTQSYIKYDTYDKWIFEFLRETIHRCNAGLKNGGILALNIANTSKYDRTEFITKNICEVCGFELIDTLDMALSSIAGKGVKTEPIFIFKKVEDLIDRTNFDIHKESLWNLE